MKAISDLAYTFKFCYFYEITNLYHEIIRSFFFYLNFRIFGFSGATHLTRIVKDDGHEEMLSTWYTLSNIKSMK